MLARAKRKPAPASAHLQWNRNLLRPADARALTAIETARMPGPDGKLVMDFNRARNPPCAYNQWTTCPLPPPAAYGTTIVIGRDG